MNKKILGIIILGVLLAAVALPTAVVLAQNTASGMAASIQVALTMVATSVVVVGWIVAGLLYLTSGGSPEKMGTAKKALIAAIAGTVLVLVAISAEDIISDLFGLG